jgi:hypothetical protein
MSPLLIAPLQPIDDRPRNHRKPELPRKPTDIKIHDLILPRIALPALREGPLLATATAPHVVIPNVHLVKKEERLEWFQMPRKKKPLLIPRHAPAFPSKYFPIGLERCEPHSYINALMQFLLFIPLLRELFAYTPPSLHPFNEFIDQYFFDIEEKKKISRADSSELIRCMLGKFPHLFRHRGVANLHAIIDSLSQCACASTTLGDAGFRPEWQILWNTEKELSLQPIFKMPIVPPEILIALQSLYDSASKPEALFCRALQRQYFSTETSACFELDAFVEHRTEGDEAGYFTYLKIDGAWVQCADERIVSLRRSTSLDLPLRRGILFHYRRVLFGQSLGIIK